MPTSSVVQILTGSIAPVIVISGVGLVLLSISNRYGRALDRARALLKQIEQGDTAAASAIRLDEQLQRTHRRAKLLRASMMYGSASIFFVSLTILALFAEYILQVHIDFLALPSFALCLLCLVASLYYSIRDITVSMGALDLEINSVRRSRGSLRS
jgi:Protein of unknown function (DUF2721)